MAASTSATAATATAATAAAAANGDDGGGDNRKVLMDNMILPSPSSSSCTMNQQQQQQQNHRTEENEPNHHHHHGGDILIRFQNQTILYNKVVDDDDDNNNNAIATAASSSSSSSSSSRMNKNSKNKDCWLLLNHVSRVTGWKTRCLEIVVPKSNNNSNHHNIKNDNDLSSWLVRVRVISSIRGGKGGFGALLKSQSRQAGAKSTTNFGACRDLQGRRLRHVNDQMALAHWREWRQKVNAGEADRVNMVQATQLETVSGVPGWHLQLPAWSDVSKKERRKWQVQFRQWKRREEAQEAAKRRDRERKESQIQMYVDSAQNAVATVQSNLQSALQEGLLQQQQQSTKRQKQQQQQAEPPVALVALSGDVEIVERSSTAGTGGVIWQIHSQSNFCTIGIALQLPAAEAVDDDDEHDDSAAVRQSNNDSSPSFEKKISDDMVLYYEVRLVTGGLAQIGWAMAPTTSTVKQSNAASAAACCFAPNSATGDGVGDDAYSYAYDGSRGICLHQSISKPFNDSGKSTSSSWEKDDIVGCMYDMRTGEISYFINGEALGVAYTVTSSPSTTSTTDGPPTHTPVMLFPAASCNPGEVIELHLYSDEMQHIPKTNNGNNPKQTLTMIGNVMATQDISFGLMLDADDCDNDDDDDDDDDQADDKRKSSSTGDGTDDAGAVAKEVVRKDSTILDEGDKKPAASDTTEAVVVVVEPVDLDTFTYAEELESLGMNRLKGALMAVGVKCGGTLTERANRLFSLKGMAAEDYPKKLLAKRKG